MARVRFLDQVPVGFYDVDNNGGSTPGGPFSSIQYNDAGTLNGDSNLLWDSNTNTVILNGSLRSTSLTGSLLGTSSFATSASQALTASYVITAQTASYVLSASYALNSSQAQTASYILNAVSASYSLSSSQAATASYVVTAQTASYVLSASYSLSSSQATTASYVNPLNQDVIITGSLNNGLDDIASGLYSHAEGRLTQANGTGSHAEGYGTQANGDYSHAEGFNTVTTTDFAHAEGIGTIANLYQHAQGAYNISSPVASAFILGNGTSDINRSNLIFAAGNQVQITGSLNVSGSITGSLFGTSSFALSSSQAQTASSILGGKATHVPYFITDTTLATSSIYQSGSTTVIINQDNATSANPEALYVWQPSTTSFNVISGKGNLNNYLQLNIQNTNQGLSSSSDIVATANNGNESTNYIDMGINSETYSQNFIGAANDAYLYSTGNDLHIGNATPNKPLQFFVGGTDVDIYNKLQLNPNNQHLMTGSLDISGSVKAFSFTGSLQGNATTSTTAQTSSYSTTLGASLSQPANNQVRLLNSAGGTLSTATVNNVTSASYADNASNATYAATAGNGGVTQIIAGSGISLIPSSGQGAVTVISTGGGGVTIISGSLVTGSFTNTTSFTFNHNLSTRTPIITVFDSNYNQIIPQNIELTNTSSATITFPTPESGFAIGSTGGTTGTALSSSYALFATYADTASSYAETDPVFVTKSASLATTGSNVFRGNQTVTGSLFTSGSNTLIGNTILSGSLNISGSQTFYGTSTSTGTQIVTGSLLTSGSNTLIGTTTLTGSLNITGSTTQTGNNTLIGTTTLTGSIFMNGDIIPQISASFDLGSVTNPWRTIYLQSGSISIQSDIPGGVPAIISNANGNVTFTQAGFQLKSGSFVPFEVSSSARTIIRVPDVPANDIGGLSIIGSSTGTYQGVTNAGGLLHLTSNDGQSSRITSDAFGTAANAAYVGRKARGTAAIPLPVQSGDVLTRISSIGWTGPEYGFTMSSSLTTAPTSIDVVALENYTTSSFGSRYNLYNVPSGSTIRTLSVQIDTTGITIPSTSKFFGTASWANNAQTASFLPAGTYNITSSWSQNAISASYAQTASFLPVGTYAITSSWAQNAISASYSRTASYVNPLNQDVTITGSLRVSGSIIEIGSTIITGSLLVTGSTTHNGNITITGSAIISGSIIMDGTAQSLVLRASATNPAALAISTFPTASYHGANYMFSAIEDSTGKTTTYNVLVATGNNRATNIQTYLIKSEGSSPTPTIATVINAGNVELRVTDTGTFTYRGIVQLF
jgi:hypothetical protein